MKNRCILLMLAAVVGCLLTPLPAGAFIGVPPQTLGCMCHLPDHIAVLRVDKISPDNGVIIFKHVEQIKGKYHGGGMKHVIPASVKGAKVIRDSAAEGKTAVMFYFWQGKGSGYVYIDGSWYQVYSQIGHASKSVPPDLCWFVAEGEPAFLAMYCGSTDKLRAAVEKILKGEEVMVPAMVGGNKRDLEEGRAKVQDIPASLKLLGDNVKPISGDDKKPDKKPKPDGTTVGAVKAIAKAADDATNLQGVWIAESMEADGEAAPAEAVKRIHFTFKGDKLFVKGNFADDREEECTFKVDAKQSPKHLEFTAPKEQKPVLGIYEVKKDELKICLRHARSADGRPTEFATKPNSKLILIVFKKQKE